MPGASVPPPFGGKYRQIMVYVDPEKLQAYQVSPMDVVRAVNNANLILPVGRREDRAVRLHHFHEQPVPQRRGHQPHSDQDRRASSMVLVSDVGHAEDANQIQNNIVEVDGQPSAYLPVMKQGGDTNTIAVVDGVKGVVDKLVDVPVAARWRTSSSISRCSSSAPSRRCCDEGGIGLVLTALMVLVFLGSARATAGVFLSIPLSALAALIMLYVSGSSINTMILAGFALVFSRLIDNAVIVLENIFRHLEMGEPPEVAAEKGGDEVAMAVLAATLTSSIVFFPVTFLYGVSRFLFSALALAVVLALVASYFVAVTVVPLFCARFLNAHLIDHPTTQRPLMRLRGLMARFNRGFAARFGALLAWYERRVTVSLRAPRLVIGGVAAMFSPA